MGSSWSFAGEEAPGGVACVVDDEKVGNFLTTRQKLLKLFLSRPGKKFAILNNMPASLNISP